MMGWGWVGGGLRMEKQAIWKIPVIFELFPKTPTGATMRPVNVQPQAGPTALEQASRLTPTPLLAQPGLFTTTPRLPLPQ